MFNSSIHASGQSGKPDKRSCIKEIDQFGIPVALTFKNERFFNTAIGGGCTIISGIIILTYIMYRFFEMLPASYGTQLSMVD